MMTGSTDVGVPREAERVGCTVLLSKPLDGGALLTQLNAIRGKPRVSMNVADQLSRP